jgi:hypothetical protein
MIDLRKPSAVSFVAGTLFINLLAMSVPASAGGAGIGGGGSRGGPGRPHPPVFLEGSPAGRAVGSGCSLSNKPVTSTSGKVTGYRRVQTCN